ncbi:DUF3649 domain-containing protein [Comamonas odontotermitis]|uniref:DUF3649 domain-containing protein n=1 Tax=Comamonas odontotermitis TaxID=379895 RepID=UPI001CC47A72|nr:DUF3649 domain-containing protein [Comamonas odontotermitis]UBB18588.1 DUF3649 domain-containing protein [Comamonas odontotermitis]
MKQSSGFAHSYRWAVLSRIAAATIGGYALASAATVLLALIWPASRSQALLWASMLSFAVYAAAVIWVFCTRSAWRAWAGMVLGSALLIALAWALSLGGAG